ncbi:unnamed protein product [Tilletia caries]|uniref:Glycoside hydrolase family 5 domain-containing protein n=1 Tax=Tilletia caries TaxID=13290 RepID=A0ABN7J9Q9_9BASI|nr:unnamed protein product [Tilletia caries]
MLNSTPGNNISAPSTFAHSMESPISSLIHSMHDAACQWEHPLTAPSSGPSAPSVSLLPPASLMSATRSAMSTSANGSSALSLAPRRALVRPLALCSSRPSPRSRLAPRRAVVPRSPRLLSFRAYTCGDRLRSPTTRTKFATAQTHRLHAQRTRHAAQRSPPPAPLVVSSQRHGGAHEPLPGLVGSRTSMLYQNDYPIQNDPYTRLRTSAPGLFPWHGRNGDPSIARMGSPVLSALLNQVMHSGPGAGPAILRRGTLSTQFYEAVIVPGSDDSDFINSEIELPGSGQDDMDEEGDHWNLGWTRSLPTSSMPTPLTHPVTMSSSTNTPWASTSIPSSSANCIESGVAYQALVWLDLLKLGVRSAQKYNIKVWIDLHGTPGSQNGYPGSGRAGGAHWSNNATYMDMTEKAFNYLVAEFTQDTYKGTVAAIQPVNEAVGAYSKPVQNLVNTYYLWAWQALAYPSGNAGLISNTMLVTHDACQRYWQNFYNAQQSEPVVMDAPSVLRLRPTGGQRVGHLPAV